MNDKLKILAISGSTRKASSNLHLVKAIAKLTSEFFALTILEGLAEIPHFNPDWDNENAPQQVKDFRRAIREADAILICTPEYAIGVPGTLKNAIDWTVSSMDFSKKPVALITASTSGGRAHESLLGTLLILESRMTVETQLLIPFVQTKVSSEDTITDNETLDKVKKLTQSLKEIIVNQGTELLSAPLLMNEGINSGSI
jgi:chromate reductase, NAD(P)H dehydrogenase (quinone)